ncbi:MAG: urease accessory protein UreE [Opitutales bacterium]|nr:urease accessory protein UreE [Opitutales bacterium]
MQIIKELPADEACADSPSVSLKVERRVLAKRRWRGQAADGTDFGFDLSAPLKHGDQFHFANEQRYQIEQLPEQVFKVAYPDPREAAHRAWQVGNLHFPAQFTDGYLLVENDLAIRQMLERNDIPFEEAEEVFQPVVAAAGHHHHHDHDHDHGHTHSHSHDHGHGHHHH